MEKIKRRDVIYKKNFNYYYDIKVRDLPTDLQPDDIIEIDIDEGHYSENESWDPFTELRILRERLETNEEFEHRKKEYEKLEMSTKENRYKLYLKLKSEFEQ